jgi:hypothetical protein
LSTYDRPAAASQRDPDHQRADPIPDPTMTSRFQSHSSAIVALAPTWYFEPTPIHTGRRRLGPRLALAAFGRRLRRFYALPESQR